MLSEEQLKGFQRIYETRFHQPLSNEDAVKYAPRFLRLIELAYTPMTREDAALVQARNATLGISKKIARSASLRDNSSNG